MDMTIGQCTVHIQGKDLDNFIQEIVEIEDKEERINLFEEMFIRETAEV